ncbi:YheC/YheD family protein [Paenibacillus sp. GCM10027628]|uniref:YheC/YheD family endospore coat-associated protein n=1 Tax=Paenibacillus sp. GCM10027628 TaxID=3273413 RepID=UPI00362D511E
MGILVNDSLFEGIPQGKTRYEAIHFYNEAGKEFGVVPCFFRIHDVKLDTLKVHAYVQQGERYIRSWIDLPKVIHNRAVYLEHMAYEQLESWTKRGIILFNRWNRYNKVLIHQLLLKDEILRPHLPGTYIATMSNIKTMMEAYDSLIIKPTNSSIGRGVMKMDRTRAGWNLLYPQSLRISNKIWRRVQFDQEIPPILQRKIRSSGYMVQQRLPLATFNGRPFDLRISVQRGAGGAWGITGIVAKVASRKLFLTNVAQGGKLKNLSEILAAEYPMLDPILIYHQVSEFSLRVARHLSKELPQLADIGLDVGITKDGFPLFIECNGKDQRYSFREANMLLEWKSTYYNPIAYAKYLLDGGNQHHE